MKYDFNKIIDRENTDSVKYNFAEKLGKSKDLIPLWVADMDFATLPEISAALKERAAQPIFGYTDAKDDYYKAVLNWFKTRFNFEFKKDWLVITPGIVFATCIAIRAFTNERDSILIQQPVYYPFARSILANNRRVINNPLIYRDRKYFIDFEDMEKKIIEHNVKLFILCSPHNPVGRVWSRDELSKMAQICIKHNVLIFSDEIHCDFIFSGHKHTILTSIDENLLENTITATAPSKTFNLAGLQNSNIFIPNKILRNKFLSEKISVGYSTANTMGYLACKIAYSYGDVWVNELVKQIDNNLQYIKDFMDKNLPQIKLVIPEGTYLIWLDCKDLNKDRLALRDFIENKAKLWIDEGEIFGEEGSGFIRINIACPIEIIKKAFNNLLEAVKSEAL